MSRVKAIAIINGLSFAVGAPVASNERDGWAEITSNERAKHVTQERPAMRRLAEFWRADNA
jgi:hypothetical protein